MPCQSPNHVETLKDVKLPMLTKENHLLASIIFSLSTNGPPDGRNIAPFMPHFQSQHPFGHK